MKVAIYVEPELQLGSGRIKKCWNYYLLYRTLSQKSGNSLNNYQENPNFSNLPYIFLATQNLFGCHIQVLSGFRNFGIIIYLTTLSQKSGNLLNNYQGNLNLSNLP